MKSHKQDIVDAAIQGLKEGGFEDYFAENLRTILNIIYESGFKQGKEQGMTEQYINSLHWSRQ